MALKVFTPGQIASGYFTLRDDTNALIDPSTLVARIENPSGTATTYTYGTDAQAVKIATGRYRIDFNTTGLAAGTYTMRIVTTGTGATAVEGKFIIAESIQD